MLKLVLVGLVSATTLACSTAAAPPAVAADVEHYLAELERIHPDPYHAVSRESYRAAADRLIADLPELSDDELLVELLRLVALLGERDGHLNMSPLAGGHRRTLHLYPVATHAFADGVYVTAAPGRPGLVGRRLVAIQGKPVDEVVRLVDPLVTFDNELSRAAHRNAYLVCAEVLHGLGVTPSAGRATFTVADAEGRRRDVALRPVRTDAYAESLRPVYPLFVDGTPKRREPLFVRRRDASQWVTTLDRGRVVYLAYNDVFADTSTTADRVLRLARRPTTRRVIVDLRNNPGGEIGTYGPLVDALRSPAVDRPGRLVVLIGRTTFSAAVHFAADLEAETSARFVGEPTGGSPNHYSDTDPVLLPVTGYTANVPRVHYVKQPGRAGLALEPDVAVPLRGRDFFAGRDPVLARALALR